jgi:hypothetical protein
LSPPALQAGSRPLPVPRQCEDRGRW